MNSTRKVLTFLFLLASFWFLNPKTISLVNAQQQKAAKYWTIENNKRFIKLNKRDIRKLNKNLAAYNAGIKKEEYLTEKK